MIRDARLLAIAIAILMVSPAFAVSRHALVIGNDTYPGNELHNARNDAKAIDTAFRGLGYASTLMLDVDRQTLSDGIDSFVDTLKPGDTAILYYAGHGFQLEGENFLVPVDFRVISPSVAKQDGYPLTSILERFTSHGATTQIVILDACRNNPFLGTRSLKGGWAGLGTSAGSLLAFGTSPGSTASDDPSDGHGLFTKYLLRYLANSDQDIEEMFRLVREDVIRDSHGTQVPWVASSLIGTYHVRPELDLTDRLLPDISDKRIELASVYQRSLQSGATKPRSSEIPVDTEAEQMSRARQLVRGGKFEEAMAILRDILRLNPASATALDLLGLLFHHSHRDLMALDMFDRALAVDPNDSSAASYKCAIEQLAGDLNGRDCTLLARDHPSSKTYFVLAVKQEADGDGPAADRSIAQAQSLMH